MSTQVLIIVLISGALAFLAGWLAGRSWLAVHLAAETRQNRRLLRAYRIFGRTVRESYRQDRSRARRRLKVAQDVGNELRRDYAELEALQEQTAGIRDQLTRSLEAANRRNQTLAADVEALEASGSSDSSELEELRESLKRRESSARVFKQAMEERDKELNSLRTNLRELRERVVPLTRAIESQRRLLKKQSVKEVLEGT